MFTALLLLAFALFAISSLLLSAIGVAFSLSPYNSTLRSTLFLLAVINGVLAVPLLTWGLYQGLRSALTQEHIVYPSNPTPTNPHTITAPSHHQPLPTANDNDEEEDEAPETVISHNMGEYPRGGAGEEEEEDGGGATGGGRGVGGDAYAAFETPITAIPANDPVLCARGQKRKRMPRIPSSTQEASLAPVGSPSPPRLRKQRRVVTYTRNRLIAALCGPAIAANNSEIFPLSLPPSRTSRPVRPTPTFSSTPLASRDAMKMWSRSIRASILLGRCHTTTTTTIITPNAKPEGPSGL
ncbi:hypothetical protein HDV00_009761 [Rhizophlyctis rosea]|nr:hypothetical protein HDV00_009761 [Rhizophlyctis rosea]